MAVCAACHQPGITTGEHTCPGPQYADIVFTRHRGQGITIDTAPAHTRIHLTVLMDRYAYLHMPDEQTVVFADQVVYRITGYEDGALLLELAEDWRPAPTVQLPLTEEQAEDIKARWKEKHGNTQAAHEVEELRPYPPIGLTNLTKETAVPTCTATIEGPHTPGSRLVQCTREAGHPENHVGPRQGDDGKVLWTDSNAGATPHRSAEEPS